jgi:hypothetical protein
MAVPVINSISPNTGSSRGGELIRLVGAGMASRVSVSFGGVQAEVVGVMVDGSMAMVRAPRVGAGVVDVTLSNLDAGGVPVPGEAVTVQNSYAFSRPDFLEESPLAQLTRHLLRLIKHEVVTSTSSDLTAVDYDESPDNDVRILEMSEVPGVVLAGPRDVKRNNFYRRVDPRPLAINGLPGQSRLFGPSLTVDASFIAYCATRGKVQTLNLINEVLRAVHLNGYLRIPLTPGGQEIGRWKLNIGEIKMPPPKDGIHVASVDLTVVGFNIDEGFELAQTRQVETPMALVEVL